MDPPKFSTGPTICGPGLLADPFGGMVDCVIGPLTGGMSVQLKLLETPFPPLTICCCKSIPKDASEQYSYD